MPALVTDIIDGDTIEVAVADNRETVRLLGIDTPEKSESLRASECFGDEATEFAASLMPVGATVLLSRDIETRDQYGRLLAHVHLPDGTHVNLALVEAGVATPLSFAPNRALRDEFEAAAAAARKAWIGFWPACGAADVVLQPPAAD